MRNPLMRQFLTIGFALSLAAGISGCGAPKVDGKYVNDGGATMTFNAGKVTLDVPIIGPSTSDYTINGNTITIKDAGTITINSDGTLSVPTLGTFKKAN